MFTRVFHRKPLETVSAVEVFPPPREVPRIERQLGKALAAIGFRYAMDRYWDGATIRQCFAADAEAIDAVIAALQSAYPALQTTHADRTPAWLGGIDPSWFAAASYFIASSNELALFRPVEGQDALTPALTAMISDRRVRVWFQVQVEPKDCGREAGKLLRRVEREADWYRCAGRSVPSYLLEIVKEIEAKVSPPTFLVCVGIIVFAREKKKAVQALEKISAAFRAIGGDKAFLAPCPVDALEALANFVKRKRWRGFFMNAEELTVLIHLPTHASVSGYMRFSPFVLARLSRPLSHKNGILIGSEISGASELRVPPDSFRCHSYVLGATGTGKSTLLTHLIDQLATVGLEQRKKLPRSIIESHDWGRVGGMLTKPEHAFSIIVVDCEGSLAHQLLRLRSEWEIDYYDPREAPYSLNPFCLRGYQDDDEREVQRSALVGTTIDVIGRACGLSQSRSPRILSILHASLNAHLSTRDWVTWMLLRELLAALRDAARLKHLIRRHNILHYEAAVLEEYQRIWSTISESVFGALYRIDDFLSSRIMRRTFSGPASTVSVDELLEPGRVSIFRFSRLDTPLNALPIAATTIILSVWLACLRRMSKVPEEKRWPVLLVIDEFQIVAELPIIEATIAEMRKAGLFLFVVNQNLEQVPEHLQAALLTNVGTLAAFRVNEWTARRLAPRFDPDLQSDIIRDLVTAPAYHAFVEIRSGDTYSPPWLVRCLPPPRETRSQQELIAALAALRKERLQELEASETEQEPAWCRIIPFPEPPPPKVYRLLLAIVEREADAKAATLNSLSESGSPYIPHNKQSLAQLFDLALSQGYIETAPLKGHTVYRLTEKARNVLFTYAGEGSAKAGLDEHIRIRQACQWRYATQGYFIVPYAERTPEAVPDSIILPMNCSGDGWEVSDAFALEVEVYPSKHMDRVRSHCFNGIQKLGLSKVLFVVADEEAKTAILEAVADLPANVRSAVDVQLC